MSTATSRTTRPVGILHYHPHTIQIISLDSEWSRRYAHDERGCSDVLQSFRDVCLRFQRTCDAVKAKNWGSEQEQGSREMFSVMPFLPVGGHADATVILLGDGLESLHEVVSGARTTVEEVTTGFCPVMKPLYDDAIGCGGVRPGDVEVWKWASNATTREMFTDPPAVFTSARLHRTTGMRVPNTPLAMLCTFKLSALAALGFGLEMEYAMCRAMVRSLLRSLHRIHHMDRELFRQKVGLKDADLKSLRICLLDLQSQEQFGILFLTSNSSLPASLISRLSSLTFAELLADNEALAKRFWKADHVERIHQAYSTCGPHAAGPLSVEQAFSKSHVFRWTRTTTGLRDDPDHRGVSQLSKGVNGFIRSHTELLIPPGHQLAAERAFFPLKGGRELINVSRHTLGRCDRLLHNGATGPNEPQQWLPTGRFLAWHYALMDKAAVGRGKGTADHWRNIAGVNVMITVPVPISDEVGCGGSDYYCPMVANEHRSPFDHILAKLKDMLFGKPGAPAQLFNRQRLQKGMIRARLPAPIQQTIENLFDNYAIILVNPYLFEGVADMWDSFQTYYHVLTEWNDDNLTNRRDAIEHVAKFAGTMNWALEHRLYRVFPEDRVRDVDIDFRGGLSQLLAAVDTVQKCAIGILRHQVLKKGVNGRDAVGVIQFAGLVPGIELKIHRFPCDRIRRLAVMRTDVSHLHHVPSYHDFWHEAFHLVQDVVVQQGGYENWKWPKPLSLPIPLQSEEWNGIILREQRIAEIMAHLLTTLFISPLDPSVIGKHLAIQYANSVRSLCEEDCPRFVFYLEKHLELFVVEEIVTRIDASVYGPTFDMKDLLKVDWAESVFEELSEQVKRALDHLGKRAPYHHEFGERVGKSGIWSEYVREKARSFLSSVRPFLGTVVGISFDIYKSSRKKAVTDMGVEGSDLKLQAWEERVASSIAGTSDDFPLTEWLDNRHGGAEIDPAFLLCATLRGVLRCRVRHFENILQQLKPGESIHKSADPRKRQEVFKSSIYCDPLGGGAMQCTDPVLRKQRSLRYIRVIKTCEGISSILRGRRVDEIISKVMELNDRSNTDDKTKRRGKAKVPVVAK